MKTLRHHPPLRAPESVRLPHWHGLSADRQSSVERRWIPPGIPHRRYPSLAEDFERVGPPQRPTYRRVATGATVFTAASLAPNDRVHPSVRVFSVLAIAAIIAALAFLR